MTRIESKYKTEQSGLQDLLQSAEFVALTADGYTQKYTHKQFDTVTVHFFSNGVLKNKTLDLAQIKASESHNSDAIKEALKKLLLKFDIQGKIKMINETLKGRTNINFFTR